MALHDPSPSSIDNPFSKPNIAVQTNPAHDLKVVTTEIPEPKVGEVIVHIKATGICGR
jgi:L-iditol 2-dehydrogenase